MATKTSLLVVSSLAVVALWATPAGADEDACYEEYTICMDRANSEPVDWIRDINIQNCQQSLEMCLATTNCGDGVCNGYENSYYCPADCQ